MEQHDQSLWPGTDQPRPHSAPGRPGLAVVVAQAGQVAFAAALDRPIAFAAALDRPILTALGA
jgi:hypothetical protein